MTLYIVVNVALFWVAFVCGIVIGRRMRGPVYRIANKMFKLLKGSATQVICTKCHTLCTYDGKVCTVCGGGQMIEPVKILDHKAVEALIGEVEGS